MKWEDVDFEAGTIHRPKPKGGVDRAFTVPVSGFVLDLLRRRQVENPPDDGWVFPTTVQRDGHLVVTHVQEVKEQRYEDGRKVTYLPSPHRLRDTCATAAKDARVNLFTIKVLLNHKLPNDDVTEGYFGAGEDSLREATEQVAAYLLKEAGQEDYAAARAPVASTG